MSQSRAGACGVRGLMTVPNGTASPLVHYVYWHFKRLCGCASPSLSRRSDGHLLFHDLCSVAVSNHDVRGIATERLITYLGPPLKPSPQHRLRRYSLRSYAWWKSIQSHLEEHR